MPVMQNHYRLLGGPGSPYSLKVRAILRYRHIPHTWAVPRGNFLDQEELLKAGKKMLPVMQYPDGKYWADSTPIAYDLEARHPGQRSIIPPDPGQAFLSHLIEDMTDEFLVLAMFDMRWLSPRDQQFCATRQISGWVSPMPDGPFRELVGRFMERQTGQRQRAVGDTNRDILQDFYRRTLAATEALLEHNLFLFGSRPSLGDFGLYGHLSQCVTDPTACDIMREVAPRTFQWVQTLEDCSGIDGDWLAPSDENPALDAFIALAGQAYLPFMAHQSAAATRGEKTITLDIFGHRWQGRVQPYKRNCLVWLRREMAAMPAEALDRIRPLLMRHGCWDALQFNAEEDIGVKAMVPF